MSENNARPTLGSLAVSAVATGALAAICYVVWEQAGELAKGTFAREFRFLFSLVVVFFLLSLLNRLYGMIRARLTKKPAD